MLLFSNACTLDVTPPASIIDDTYWRNEKDATDFLNNIYSQLAPGSSVYGDTHSNDGFAQYTWESNSSLFQQDQMNASNTTTGWGFGGIGAVNDFLANVDKCNMDADLKERMKAEARALRAIYYLTKTLTLGKVPIITTILDPATKTLERNSVDEVREFICTELDAVAKILPESYAGGNAPNEKTRVTKYAAYAYLARAYLYFGNYQKAETYASLIIDSQKYDLFKISSLSPEQQLEAIELENYIDFDALGIDRATFLKGIFSYEGIWHDNNANATNPEYIFCRQYMDESGHRDWARFKGLRPSQLGGWSSVNPTQPLVNAYWTVEGKEPTVNSPETRGTYYAAIMKAYNDEKKISNISFIDFCAKINADGSIKNYDFIKEFRNRDSRMYASILFPFKGWFETEYGTNFYYEWRKGASNESKVGYNFRKITPLRDNTSGKIRESVADYPSFRLAEVLLIYAEARTQNIGYDGSVVTQLNRIRSRAGMPNVPNNFASKDAALEFIRAERRIELALEGRRDDDLSRYPNTYWEKMMNNVDLTSVDGEKLFTMKWSERMRLRPIAQSAMDRNAALRNDQNPGY